MDTQESQSTENMQGFIRDLRTAATGDFFKLVAQQTQEQQQQYQEIRTRGSGGIDAQ